MGAKGASGLPSITTTLRLRPPRSPRPLRLPGTLPPTYPPPTSPVFAISGPTLGHTRRTQVTHLILPLPPHGYSLGSSGHAPPGQGPSLGTGGSYRAVGCPHRHLPPGPRHLHIRPHLRAVALGSRAALLQPCSAVRTRLSGTAAWEGLRTGLPHPLDPPPTGKVPSRRLTPQGSAPGASLQATPPAARQTPSASTQAMPLESLSQSHTPAPSISGSFLLPPLGPRLRPDGPAPQVPLAGPSANPHRH